MESRLSDTWGIIWTNSNVLWTHKLTSHFPDDDEYNLQMTGYAGMVLHFYGRWYNSHKTSPKQNPRITPQTTSEIHPWDLRYSSRKWPICQTGKMCLWTRRNQLPRCHHRQRTAEDRPEEIARCGQLPSPAERHRCSSIPQIHWLLQILCSKLLSYCLPTAWPHQKGKHIQMGIVSSRGIRQD